MKTKKLLLVGALFLLLLGLPQVQATMVTLSDFVSDGADPPDVVDLSATLDFSVADGILDVVVANLTHLNVSGNEYVISEIYFNAPDELDDVDGLDMIEVIGGVFGQWNQATQYSENGFNVDNFGRFDMKVTDGGKFTIGPGEIFTFRFAINGPGTYTGDDFALLMSDDTSPPEGGEEMLAVAKFEQGPDDLSGFGATNVPEPATVALLGMGALLLFRRKPRKG